MGKRMSKSKAVALLEDAEAGRIKLVMTPFLFQVQRERYAKLSEHLAGSGISIRETERRVSSLLN